MNEADLLQALSDLEGQLLHITEAVHRGDAQVLETSATVLRASVLSLMAAMEHPDISPVHAAMVQGRLQQLTSQLRIARAGMMRQAALVEQTLQAMVPGALSATYAAQPSPYGAARKRTGAFQTLAA